MTDLAHPGRALFHDLVEWTSSCDSVGAPVSGAQPVVSMYVPIDPMQRHLDRLELRAAVAWAEHSLVHDHGVSRTDAIAMLAPIAAPEYAHAADGDSPIRGVAWFVSRHGSTGAGLPGAVGPSVTIGAVADTIGLVPFVDAGPSYFVLAFSQHDVRLFAADRFGVRPVRVPDLPRTLDDALWYVRREPTFERHGSGVMHMSGDGRSHHKDDLRRFAQLVADAVEPAMGTSADPLVVMGVGYETAIVADVFDRRPVLRAETGSPDHFSPSTVHELSWGVVAEHADPAADAVAMVAELLGTGRAVTAVADIDEWARQGAVQSLLVSRPLTDPPRTQGSLEGDRALLADAITHAVATGASVYAIEPDRLPSGCIAAAVLRW